MQPYISYSARNKKIHFSLDSLNTEPERMTLAVFESSFMEITWTLPGYNDIFNRQGERSWEVVFPWVEFGL